jgi:predicted nucleic acid-binding protein
MTEEDIIFDSDCFRSFLEIEEEGLLFSLFPKRIYLPFDVYHELSAIPNLSKKIEGFKEDKAISIFSFFIPDPLLQLYVDLISPKDGRKKIGRGEASAIVFAKKFDAFLASNNLSDIMTYVDKFELKIKTSSIILCDAIRNELISLTMGEKIWKNMDYFNNYLPTKTLERYYKNFYLNGKL